MIETTASQLLGVAILFWAFALWKGWRYLTMQWVRLDLFILRDELHALAVKGEVQRNAEYRSLRARINSDIHSAHLVSGPLILGVLLGERFSRGMGPVAFSETLPPVQNPTLRQFTERVKNKLGIYFLLRAPLAFGVLLFWMLLELFAQAKQSKLEPTELVEPGDVGQYAFSVVHAGGVRRPAVAA